MSGKRQAPYQIDQKTLEDKPIAKEAKQAPEESQIPADKPNDQVADRTILTVNKDSKKEQKNDDKNPQPKETTQQPKPKSSNLFSDLFSSSQQNGNGLFTSTSSGLFGSGQATSKGSIFSNTSSSNGSSIFANKDSSAPKTSGLFSSTGKSSESLFNFQNGVPPIKGGQASLFNNDAAADDSGDSAELQAAQNLDADPSKSLSNFKYQEASTVIFSERALRFKKQGGDLIQNVDVSAHQDKQKKLFYLTVSLPATKKEIFTGLLLVGKSQVRHLNQKAENVEVSAFQLAKQSIEKSIIKVQFQLSETGNRLHDIISQIIKGEYKPTTSESKETDNVPPSESKKEQEKQVETKKNTTTTQQEPKKQENSS